MIGDLLVIIVELDVENYLAEKNPRAAIGRDEVRAFTDPAETGTHGPGFVHHRRRVDTDLAVRVGSFELYAVEQLVELFFYDVVIIVAPRVSRYLAALTIMLMWREVI